MSRFFEDNSSLLLSCRSTTTTVIVAVVGGVVFFVRLLTTPERDLQIFYGPREVMCISFFRLFRVRIPQKAVLVFFFPNLRHQVFRGGGSLGASIVRQPLGLKMRSPRIVLIYINLMKLKKKLKKTLQCFTSPQILNFSSQNYFSF